MTLPRQIVECVGFVGYRIGSSFNQVLGVYSLCLFGARCMSIGEGVSNNMVWAIPRVACIAVETVLAMIPKPNTLSRCPSAIWQSKSLLPTVLRRLAMAELRSRSWPLHASTGQAQ